MAFSKLLSILIQQYKEFTKGIQLYSIDMEEINDKHIINDIRILIILREEYLKEMEKKGIISNELSLSFFNSKTLDTLSNKEKELELINKETLEKEVLYKTFIQILHKSEYASSNQLYINNKIGINSKTQYDFCLKNSSFVKEDESAYKCGDNISVSIKNYLVGKMIDYKEPCPFIEESKYNNLSSYLTRKKNESIKILTFRLDENYQSVIRNTNNNTSNSNNNANITTNNSNNNAANNGNKINYNNNNSNNNGNNNEKKGNNQNSNNNNSIDYSNKQNYFTSIFSSFKK